MTSSTTYIAVLRGGPYAGEEHSVIPGSMEIWLQDWREPHVLPPKEIPTEVPEQHHHHCYRFARIIPGTYRAEFEYIGQLARKGKEHTHESKM